MNTKINKLYVNEIGDQITFDIAINAPYPQPNFLEETTFLLYDITIEPFDNVVFNDGIPSPSNTPSKFIPNSELLTIDYTFKTLIKDFSIDPIGNSLLFIFVRLCDTEDVLTPVLTEIFVIHNEYTYAKAFINLTKKLNQNNVVPKELLDLILLKKAVHYATISSNYLQADLYFQKLTAYYD
jgi:hypothetical protein